jgi:membrane fusion protein (multidrug efflux system)/multidrug efflux system membrane fusion protein
MAGSKLGAPVYGASFLLFGLASSCKGNAGAAANARPAPLVVVQKIELADVPVEVRAPVDLRPLEQADVGSKILGYIDAVLVDRGDRVKKGQLVALVRPSDLPDQLAAARGGLAQVEASAALARTNYERAQKLAPTGVVSQQEVQQSSAALASAEAAESAAKAQIGALAVRIGETRIESPIDGVISQRRLDPGALVGPPGGGAIVTVVRIDRLRVFITANEKDAAGITVGKEAHVELDALPGKSYDGVVVRVAPSFDPVTRTLDAEVQLSNESGELRPGMYGRASIRLAMHAHVPVVSANALQMSESRKYVFVLKGENVARRPVNVGADVSDGQLFEVTQGLTAGEEVVTAGADGLSDGSAVRVTRDVDPYNGAKTSGNPAPAGSSARGPVRD